MASRSLEGEKRYLLERYGLTGAWTLGSRSGRQAAGARDRMDR